MAIVKLFSFLFVFTLNAHADVFVTTAIWLKVKPRPLVMSKRLSDLCDTFDWAATLGFSKEIKMGILLTLPEGANSETLAKCQYEPLLGQVYPKKEYADLFKEVGCFWGCPDKAHFRVGPEPRGGR